MDCVAAATAGLISLKFRQFQRLSRQRLLSVKQRPVTMRTCAPGPRFLGDDMVLRGWASILRAGSALGLLAIATAQANAGGLAAREQSVYGQGSSFAGIAAGGALSSMFWNPATMTQFSGIVSETDVSGIFPYASHTPTSGILSGFPGTSNVGNAVPLPAGYTSYQLSPDIWVGLSINAPFGLSENFPDNWAGRFYATGDQLLKTYNATPSLAWRINDWISVGVGFQIQYAKAIFEQGLPLGGGPGGVGSQGTLRGSGWAYGATAGVTLTPTPTTTIGLGWRSALNQKIEGTLVTSTSLPATTTGSITTTLDLPDIVSLGIRQRVDPRWTLLGTVEWTNWSRIGTSSIVAAQRGACDSSRTPACHTVPVAGRLVLLRWRRIHLVRSADYAWRHRL